jgi:hypothetical protein
MSFIGALRQTLATCSKSDAGACTAKNVHFAGARVASLTA